MDQVKQEIKEWEKAKTEYQEIVIQMQNKGIFLGIDSVPIFLGSVPAMPELVCKLKSEVAIASLFCQIQQTKKILLQVKTIRNGIAESVKSCHLHKKGSFKA